MALASGPEPHERRPRDETLLSRIEDAGLNASAPPQQRWLDGWLVRFSPGKAKRARCINAVAPAACRWPTSWRLARQVFDAAGLPMVVRITRFTSLRRAGQDNLADLGWQAAGRHAGHGLRRLTPAMDRRGGCPPAPVGTLERTRRDLRQAVGGGPARLAARAARGPCRALALSPVPYQGWVLRRDGEVVLACGQSRAKADLVGLYDIFTAPAAPQPGPVTLCAPPPAQRERAVKAPAPAYLQVEADNTGAPRSTSAWASPTATPTTTGRRPIGGGLNRGAGLQPQPLVHPRCTFMACTAAPLAPLPRLSSRAISRPALVGEHEDVDAVAVVAGLHVEEAASSVAGSRSGMTRMKRSPA
jgi:hypothetical protein